MKVAAVSAYAKPHVGIRADLIRSLVECGHEVFFDGDPEDEWRGLFASGGCRYRQFYKAVSFSGRVIAGTR